MPTITKKKTTPTRRSRVTRKIYKPAQSLPGRFYAGSKRTYNKTKALGNQMRNFAETSYIALTNKDSATPHQVQSTNAYFKGFTLGPTVPTGWTSYESLDGMTVAQGTGQNQRIGASMYIKNTHLNMEIDMVLPDSGVDAHATEFRVIVFKVKPAARNLGVSLTPNTSLFLDTSGNQIGHESTGVTGTDLMLQSLDRRRWVIYRDQKFTLSPQLKPTTSGGWTSTKYQYEKARKKSAEWDAKVRAAAKTFGAEARKVAAEKADYYKQKAEDLAAQLKGKPKNKLDFSDYSAPQYLTEDELEHMNQGYKEHYRGGLTPAQVTERQRNLWRQATERPTRLPLQIDEENDDLPDYLSDKSIAEATRMPLKARKERVNCRLIKSFV